MKNLLIYLMAAFVLVGCEKFLDTESLTKKDGSNFPENPTDVSQLLTGAYAALRDVPGDQDHIYLVSELLSDDCFGGGGPEDYPAHAFNALKKSNENMFSNFWARCYKGIYRCNSVFDAIEKVEWESDAQRNAVKGQAHFLRAYFYFDLARLFGGVPLITSTEPVNFPRAEPEALYAQMASDLVTAIELLPATSFTEAATSDLGRATKWAAEALLGRVYLFYTGYYNQPSLPLLQGSLSKEQVAAHLKDCIDKSGHDLVADFRNLWPYSNQFTKPDYSYSKNNNLNWIGETDKTNNEAIFSICFSAMGAYGGLENLSNRMCLFVSPRDPKGENTFPAAQGWGQGPVNSDLWKNWPAGDIRREGSIMDARAEMPTYTAGAENQMHETGYFQKKYMAINAKDQDETGATRYRNFSYLVYGSSGPDYMLNNTQNLVSIRFADVLLMHSELTGSADGLNRVRSRAGLAAVGYSEQALRDERRYELAFEGLRYFDLMRWGIAAQELDKQNGVEVRNANVAAKMNVSDIVARYNATKGLMPIPQTEISLSAGVLVQNPGWGSEANL